MNQDSPKPNFKSFGLSLSIYSEVEKAGFTIPTDVQQETIPAVLQGKDVLARAETGSGKTAAFVLPILEKTLREYSKPNKGTIGSNIASTLVLVPTRELAIQIREEFERFSSGFLLGSKRKVKCLSVYGGVKINPQMIALRGGADILVATPGRLLDLERNNAIRLHQVKTLVIDEVDRLMKGDFQEEIDQIIAKLANKRQNLMFTATFPSSIRKLVRYIMDEPVIINVDDFNDDVNTEQRVITVNHDKKNDLLAHLLKENDWKQVLIFCSAKRTCDNLVRKLEKRNIEASAMHGNQHQYARANALKDFKAKKIRILIATDVAGRGVDIEQLDCVINYELPRSPNDYTHRIGRTGRAGAMGMAISLIAHHEFQHFGVIEKRIGLRLEREQLKGFEADEKAPEIQKSSKKKKSKKQKKLNSKKKLKQIDNTLDKDTKTNGSNEKPQEKSVKYNKPDTKQKIKQENKPSSKSSVKTDQGAKESSEPKVDGSSFYKRKLPKNSESE
jgi:superfamily II DNA/RNA helicase